MAKRKENKTSCRNIVLANIDLLHTLPNVKFVFLDETSQTFQLSSYELSVLTTTCWACGYLGITPDRAHIVAYRIGGEDTPTNYFLLCGLCHAEQPDGVSKKEQIKWLKEREFHITAQMKWFKAIILQLKIKKCPETYVYEILTHNELVKILKRAWTITAGYHRGNINANLVALLRESYEKYKETKKEEITEYF